MKSVKVGVSKGKVVYNRERLAQLFQSLKDGEYKINIEGLYLYKGRYKFYRGILLEYILEALELKCTNQALHEYCKLMFCDNPIFNPITGEILALKGGTTTALSDEQFDVYKEKIRAHFAVEYEVEFTI